MKYNDYSNSEELFDVRIEKGTFIKFEYLCKVYRITSNICGLKSFVSVLNHMLEKKYNFVRLSDLSLNDSYTNHPECFFDKSSITLELEKVNGKGSMMELIEFHNNLDNDCVRIRLSRKMLLSMKNKVQNLTELSNDGYVKFNLVDNESKENISLEIIRNNQKSIRIY